MTTVNENKQRAQELADKVYDQLSQAGSGMFIAPQMAQTMLPAIQLAGVYAQLAQIDNDGTTATKEN